MKKVRVGWLGLASRKRRSTRYTLDGGRFERLESLLLHLQTSEMFLGWAKAIERCKD